MTDEVTCLCCEVVVDDGLPIALAELTHGREESAASLREEDTPCRMT